MRKPKTQHPIRPETWVAFGQEKQEWKKQGNHYTAEELALLEASLRDLKVRPAPPVRIHVQ